MPASLPPPDVGDAERLSDIDPPPTLAVSARERRIALDDEPRALLRDLLDATDERRPIRQRVFERLGVDYHHLRWQAYDLYWAGDEDVFVEALRNWKRSPETK